MITGFDYFIVGFYLLFIRRIGLAFRRMSKNPSDCFRAGGATSWWTTGTSAWIASFTAWALPALPHRYTKRAFRCWWFRASDSVP